MKMHISSWGAHSPVSLYFLRVEGEHLEMNPNKCIKCDIHAQMTNVSGQVRKGERTGSRGSFKPEKLAMGSFWYWLQFHLRAPELSWQETGSVSVCVCGGGGGGGGGTHLSGPLQVAEVDVRDEEDGLRLQVGHGLEIRGVGLFGRRYHTHSSVLPWRWRKKEHLEKSRYTFSQHVDLLISYKELSRLRYKIKEFSCSSNLSTSYGKVFSPRPLFSSLLPRK